MSMRHYLRRYLRFVPDSKNRISRFEALLLVTLELAES